MDDSCRDLASASCSNVLCDKFIDSPRDGMDGGHVKWGVEYRGGSGQCVDLGNVC